MKTDQEGEDPGDCPPGELAVDLGVIGGMDLLHPTARFARGHSSVEREPHPVHLGQDQAGVGGRSVEIGQEPAVTPTDRGRP